MSSKSDELFSKASTNSEAFIESTANLVNPEDIGRIIESQRHMLSRFEKTNEMLVNCNALTAIRMQSVNRELLAYTRDLTELKSDLDSIFRRIRFLKLKLSQKYPQAFKVCGEIFNVLDEEEETGEEVNTST